jgi:alanine-glyoxylate transaminase/serine-glyoxylate transaminase/serine-pyruvate transaminase
MNIPDPVIRAMNRQNEDYRSPAIPALTKVLLEDVKKIFKTTTSTLFLIPTTGTGAWESALTNTLSPGDRIISFLIGQFSLLWTDQHQRLGFDVDVVESDWGHGADLAALERKLRMDTRHTIKAVAIVHNETATGVTNDLAWTTGASTSCSPGRRRRCRCRPGWASCALALRRGQQDGQVRARVL